MIRPGHRFDWLARAQLPPLAPILALAVGVDVVLLGLDLTVDHTNIPAATYTMAPVIAAIAGRWRATAGVTVLSLAFATWSVLDHGDSSAVEDWLRLATIVLVGSLSVLGSMVRDRLALTLRRQELLSAAAAVGEGELPLAETAQRLADLVVHELGDHSAIDVLDGDESRRIASAGGDPAVVAAAVARGDTSTLIVPLRTRGRTLGSLRLALADPADAFSADDARFAGILAGRMALALDNAGLSVELRGMQQRMAEALDGLPDPVVLRDRSGHVTYANQAAATLMEVPDAEDITRAAPGALMAGYDVVDEDGGPVSADDLPSNRVLAGDDPSSLVLRAQRKADGHVRWVRLQASPLHDADGSVSAAVTVIEDITSVKQVQLDERFLADATMLLSSSLDYETTLQRVAELSVPDYADWCAVDVIDDRHQVSLVAVAHRDPAKTRYGRELRERFPVNFDADQGVARVLRTGESDLHPTIDTQLLRSSARTDEELAVIEELGFVSGLVAPLTVAGRVIGAMTWVTSESGRHFDDHDLRMAEELGRRAAIAVENARLYTARTEIADLLQRSLLPDSLPSLDGWDVAGLFRPAGEFNSVGGDFYDLVQLTDGCWLAVIGDVAGKGAPAAALTARARHTLITAAAASGDPRTGFEWLNEQLLNRGEWELCSAAVMRIDTDRATADVSCAGHPRPLLTTPGAATRFVGATGPMLGTLAGASWELEPVELAPGSTLLAYTDGVTDAVGADGRFRDSRLVSLADRHAARPATELVAELDRALREFAVGPQRDDVAALAVHRRSG